MATVSPSLTLNDMVPEIDLNGVQMKNPQFVEKTICNMIKDTHHKLQVVSDFDRTLSKYKDSHGRLCCCTHGVFRGNELMPKDFTIKDRKLKNYYLPIEMDYSKPVEEKIPKMIEWWIEGCKLLMKSNLTRSKLSPIVSKSRIRLRINCDWLLDKLHELEIPLLISSAGIGNIIKETIAQQATYHDNVHLATNFLTFDENDSLLSYTEGDDVIHSYNKNKVRDHYEQFKHRTNLLLLGDSITDASMADGADSVDCLLKIGFLNFEVDERLPVFLEHFDIVIIDDESMDVVNAIIKAVERNEKVCSF